MVNYLYEKEIEYKVSVFTKHKVHIRVAAFTWEYVSVSGLDNAVKNDNVVDVAMPIDDNISVEPYLRKDVEGLLIKGTQKNTSARCEVFVPGITDYEGVCEAIDKAKAIIRKRNEEEIEENKRKEEKRLRLLREEEELKEKRKRFLDSEYAYIKENYPTFFIDEHDQFSTFLYVDENKNLTIKSIDKEKMEMVSSTINYKALHYYEKAGNIHYVSNINVNYDNSAVAASFVPSKIKMTPVVIGTLLFGPMGMAAGAMLGYKGAHFENAQNAQNVLNVSSNTARIDDRSVILNYYSEKNKQYTDIELPHDIYNFLQTHLAEKKYDIVLANEKRSYTSPDNISFDEKRQDYIEIKTHKQSKMSLEEFEIAVKKLKLMVDNEIISQDEFDKKKNELMDSIL